MGPGARHGEPALRARLLHRLAQQAQLAHGAADAAVHAGPELRRRGVRLRGYARREDAGEARQHLVDRLRERPGPGVEEHDLLLDAERERRGLRPGRPGGRRPQLAGSTHVSLPPPPCDELTTSSPSANATRVSPPGSARARVPSKKTNGRTSTWRGASAPPITVGCVERRTVSCATSASG